MFTWDDSELRAQLKLFESADQRFLDVAEKELKPFAEFLETRVKANVPKKTGNLESHVKVKVVREKEFIGVVLKAETDYALEVHERPAPLDGEEPEGGRGPKYLTRVVDFHAKEWGKVVERIEEKALKS